MEQCLDCYNREAGTHLTESQVILSSHHDLSRCNRCGGIHRVVVRIPSATPWGWLQCRFWAAVDKLGG